MSKLYTENKVLGLILYGFTRWEVEENLNQCVFLIDVECTDVSYCLTHKADCRTPFFFFSTHGTSLRREMSRQVILYTRKSAMILKDTPHVMKRWRNACSGLKWALWQLSFIVKREECCGETWLEATLKKKKIWQYFILKHGKLDVSNKALLLNPLSVWEISMRQL